MICKEKKAGQKKRVRGETEDLYDGMVVGRTQSSVVICKDKGVGMKAGSGEKVCEGGVKYGEEKLRARVIGKSSSVRKDGEGVKDDGGVLGMIEDMEKRLKIEDGVRGVSPGSSVSSVVTPSGMSTGGSVGSGDRVKGEKEGRGKERKKLPKSRVFYVRGGSGKGKVGSKVERLWDTIVEDLSDDEEGLEGGNLMVKKNSVRGDRERDRGKVEKKQSGVFGDRVSMLGKRVGSVRVMSSEQQKVGNNVGDGAVNVIPIIKEPALAEKLGTSGVKGDANGIQNQKRTGSVRMGTGYPSKAGVGVPGAGIGVGADAEPQYGCIPLTRKKDDGRMRGYPNSLSPHKTLRSSMMRVSLQCDDYIRFMMRNNSQYCLKQDRKKRGKPKRMIRSIYKTFVRTFKTR